MNYLALKNKLAEPGIIALTDDIARVAALDAEDIEILGTISKGDLKTYLRLNSLWLPLKASPSQTAIFALEILNDPDTTDTSFDLADPVAKLFLENMLDALITDITEMTITHKDAIIAIGISHTSWARKQGYIPLRVGYLAKARALL